MSPNRKEILYSIGLGIILMIIALIIQSILQSIPEIYFLARFGAKVLSQKIVGLEMGYPLLYAIYIGGLAGIMQELFKYLGVELKPKQFASWIGLGFSLVDIFVLLIDVSLTRLVSILILLNIIVSLSFHPGTAMLLKYGRLINRKYLFLATAIILHAFIDGGVAYLDILEILIKAKNTYLYTNAYWAIVMVISLSVLLTGWVLINRVEEKQ